MKLECLLVADPKNEAAELVAEQCERLARRRLVVSHTDDLLAKARVVEPEMLLVSLELPGLPIEKTLKKLRQMRSDALIIASYREMSVRDVERLGSLGLQEVLPHPVEIIEVFRAASRFFKQPFRRHERYDVCVDVFRADEVMIGKTLDISEGGMRIRALHPVKEGESLLLELALPDAERRLRVRAQVLDVQGQAPAPVHARLQFVRLWGPEQRRLMTYLAAESGMNAG